MPQDEIVTALKNAIEHGESLQTAMQILVNSGYASSEVQEASKFVCSGALNIQKQKPEEQLAMPSKKTFLSKFTGKLAKPKAQSEPAPQAQPKPAPQTQPKETLAQQVQHVQQTQQIRAQTAEEAKKPLTKQISKINQQKGKHVKEIILLVVLLVLIAILITVIYFKDTILGWFS